MGADFRLLLNLFLAGYPEISSALRDERKSSRVRLHKMNNRKANPMQELYTTQATVVVLGVCTTLCYLAYISLRIQRSKERAENLFFIIALSALSVLISCS